MSEINKEYLKDVTGGDGETESPYYCEKCKKYTVPKTIYVNVVENDLKTSVPKEVCSICESEYPWHEIF